MGLPRSIVSAKQNAAPVLWIAGNCKRASAPRTIRPNPASEGLGRTDSDNRTLGRGETMSLGRALRVVIAAAVVVAMIFLWLRSRRSTQQNSGHQG